MNDHQLTSELLSETATISWRELQRFFASGHAIAVDSSLDLIYVASQITKDNADQIKIWMDSGLVDAVNDSQAKVWYEQNTLVWAIVIKPWVLVQQRDTNL